MSMEGDSHVGVLVRHERVVLVGLVLGLDKQRVSLSGGDGQFVDGVWCNFDAVDFDYLHLVVLHREMEH